jgi:hypothetical protein
MLATLAAHLQPAAVAAQTHAVGAAGAALQSSVTVVGEAGLEVVTGDEVDAEAEAREYKQLGLVVPGAHLSADTATTLQDLLLRTLAVTTAADPPIEMPIAPNCPTNLYGAHGAPIPTDVAAVWMALCRHPAILDRVQSVLGPDIILWGSQLFHKPAETGLEVPWQCVWQPNQATFSPTCSLHPCSIYPSQRVSDSSIAKLTALALAALSAQSGWQILADSSTCIVLSMGCDR